MPVQAERLAFVDAMTGRLGQIRDQAIAQVISAPQHSGDLIFPCSFGHFDTCTVEPSSRVRTSFTKGASQWPHVALTVIPQTEHS